MRISGSRSRTVPGSFLLLHEKNLTDPGPAYRYSVV